VIRRPVAALQSQLTLPRSAKSSQLWREGGGIGGRESTIFGGRKDRRLFLDPVTLDDAMWKGFGRHTFSMVLEVG
jgi:hypothetical protein